MQQGTLDVILKSAPGLVGDATMMGLSRSRSRCCHARMLEEHSFWTTIVTKNARVRRNPTISRTLQRRGQDGLARAVADGVLLRAQRLRRPRKPRRERHQRQPHQRLVREMSHRRSRSRRHRARRALPAPKGTVPRAIRLPGRGDGVAVEAVVDRPLRPVRHKPASRRPRNSLRLHRPGIVVASNGRVGRSSQPRPVSRGDEARVARHRFPRRKRSLGRSLVERCAVHGVMRPHRSAFRSTERRINVASAVAMVPSSAS